MGTRYRYTEEDLATAVEQSFSIAGVMRILGVKPAGGSHFHMSKRIQQAKLDTSHFTGQRHNAGKQQQRRPAEYFFVRRDPNSGRLAAKYLRRSLREIGVAYCCSECGVGDTWQERPLILHVDHIDGDHHNCLQDNLRFLCPNCHSQTQTYCKTVSTRTAQGLA